MVVDTAPAEAEYCPPNLDEERACFIEEPEALKVSEVVRENPTVHAELVLIIRRPRAKSATWSPTSVSRNCPALCAVTISAP